MTCTVIYFPAHSQVTLAGCATTGGPSPAGRSAILARPESPATSDQ